jgi:hypothetical protein
LKEPGVDDDGADHGFIVVAVQGWRVQIVFTLMGIVRATLTVLMNNFPLKI